MQKRPAALQERVFRKIFKLAEIAKYNKMERIQYEESLKQYRDMRNVVSYARKEGREIQIIRTIKVGLQEGLSLEVLSKLTQLSIEDVKKIIEEQGWKIE